MSVFVSQCALSVCFGIQERAKSWTPFLLGYIVNVALMLILKRSRSVPLMGWPQGPSVSRSPGTAPQKKAGRPMGPSTPLCQPQSFLTLVLALMLKPKGSCFVILWRCFALGKCVWFSEPFKLWALCCLLLWFSLGPLLGGGCIVIMTFFSTT